jgi:TolB-like protein/tetratricopeptide (TPR) repeat protein
MEMQSRIESPPERYKVDDVLLDVDACTLTRGDTPIALPPGTFELLVELVRRYPRVVRREELLDVLWPREEVLDEALSQRVMLLRRALGDTAARPRYVALVRKRGYKIAAHVERLGTECPRAGAAPDAGEAGVAVLPFLDLSVNRDREYLCEGLAEEIINALAGMPGMRVIARTSSFAIGRMGLDVRESGRRLGVQAILEGSVRCDGQMIRVVAQLVSTTDGSHLWSERYDRELTDVLVLEDEIANAVAAGLGRRLRGETALRSPGRVDAAAHSAYLEGRYHFAKGTPEAFTRAGACFSKAVERDPHFALAYDSLAELHWYLGFFGSVPPRDAFSLSTWHALRALELDDSLAQTHALLAMLRKELDYNWPEVDRELDRARQLAPNSPQVRLRHAISGLLPHGRVAEAAAEVEGVLADDPLSLVVRWWLAIMLYLDRRFDSAADAGRQMIALDATHFLGHWVIGIANDQMGRKSEAIDALERAHELSGGIPFTLGFLGMAYGRAGHPKTARRLLAAAHERAKAGYFPPSAIAIVHLGVGERDDALIWLDRAIEARDPIVMPIKTFPFLDPVRGHPRFGALLKKMNLT